MAIPPEISSVTMLEVDTANNAATNDRNGDPRMGSSSQILPLSNGPQNDSLDSAPVMIFMNHDDYTRRPTRESVLQRLSEALLRRSLAQVGTFG